MSNKLKSSKRFVKELRECGYYLDRSNGSHFIYENKNGNTKTVPLKLNKMVEKKLLKELAMEKKLCIR